MACIASCSGLLPYLASQRGIRCTEAYHRVLAVAVARAAKSWLHARCGQPQDAAGAETETALRVSYVSDKVDEDEFYIAVTRKITAIRPDSLPVTSRMF